MLFSVSVSSLSGKKSSICLPLVFQLDKNLFYFFFPLSPVTPALPGLSVNRGESDADGCEDRGGPGCRFSRRSTRRRHTLYLVYHRQGGGGGQGSGGGQGGGSGGHVPLGLGRLGTVLLQETQAAAFKAALLHNAALCPAAAEPAARSTWGKECHFVGGHQEHICWWTCMVNLVPWLVGQPPGSLLPCV